MASEFFALVDGLRRAATSADGASDAGHATAAVALILSPFGAADAPGGLQARLLLIRRADFPGDPWSGDVALPGGKRDRTDASLRSTVVREVGEELGLALDEGALVGRLADVTARSSALRIARFVFATPADVALHPGPEVREAFWLPVTGFSHAGRTGTLERVVGDRRVALPYVEVEGRVVTGLTLRMIRDALDIAAATRGLEPG